MNNTFYFSHDYNSRTDEKIKKLIRKFGMEGYGTYWAIVEDLYQNANALQADSEGIAFDMRVSEDIVYYILNESGLFIIEDGIFYSKSIQNRLDQREEKSSKARESAMKRWSKKNANALQTQSDRNAIKERKGKENKEKENKDNNIIPKGITTEVEDKEFGNKEINEMLGFLCKAIGVDQFKESQRIQRQYAYHFINFAKKNGREDFIQRLKGITGDPFKAKNCNSLKYLYGEVKSYIHSPLTDNSIKRC